MADLIEQLNALHVWPQFVADEHADILTPRQIEGLYGVGTTAHEAATALEAAQARIAALEGALTPSGDTKAAYMGEFSFNLTQVDEFGDEQAVKIYVPWTTIKEIMSVILSRSTLAKGEGKR